MPSRATSPARMVAPLLAVAAIGLAAPAAGVAQVIQHRPEPVAYIALGPMESGAGHSHGQPTVQHRPHHHRTPAGPAHSR